MSGCRSPHANRCHTSLSRSSQNQKQMTEPSPLSQVTSMRVFPLRERTYIPGRRKGMFLVRMAPLKRHRAVRPCARASLRAGPGAVLQEASQCPGPASRAARKSRKQAMRDASCVLR